MSRSGPSPERDELNRVSSLLIAEWERVEGKPVNVSYVATFVDMARVVIADAARALDARDQQWQERLVPLADGNDGAGCESGDPLDCGVAAVSLARNRLLDRVEEAERDRYQAHTDATALRDLLRDARAWFITDVEALKEMGYDDAEDRNGIRRLAKRIDVVLEMVAGVTCTGVTAVWCPICGDCGCEKNSEGTPTLTDERCSLHAPDSTHAPEVAA